MSRLTKESDLRVQSSVIILIFLSAQQAFGQFSAKVDFLRTSFQLVPDGNIPTAIAKGKVVGYTISPFLGPSGFTNDIQTDTIAGTTSGYLFGADGTAMTHTKARSTC